MPLTVLGGFLGAGKTTLLNHWLRRSRGRRIAALVNDFGAVNIDAALIASANGDTIALTNGCVCCSIGDDLTAALIRVIEATPPFDAVIVEASGVADPWRIAQVGRADPALALDAVIVLVDAGAALEQARDPLLADSLERQLQAADLVVVNKTDLVDAAARARVADWVRSVAGNVPLFETAQADVPLPLLAGVAPQALDAARQAHAERCEHGLHRHGRDDHDASHGDEPHDHDELFETWLARPQQPLSAAALRARLRDMPAGVLRLKGLLRTDELGGSDLQVAGRHGALRRLDAEPPGGPAVVAIGRRGALPIAALDALFEVGAG
ncbi:MAG: GTP-binding protein [Rubrivivax sp.]|nr:GTP-binding protein [Rubrivivax sp.]